MKSSAKKVELAPYDDLFSTEESRQDAKLEKVREIPLSELHPFKNHPFKVKDDEAMMETADSVRQYGVLVPAIARPDPEGGYELVAGHRRHRASELAEKETMPVIVRDLDDDAATIIMVDSNLQRESLLPSERAFAYKMKLEAMKHQGERMDLTCSQVGNKSAGKKSSELLAEQVGQSKNQIFRYIRLTELIPELLDIPTPTFYMKDRGRGTCKNKALNEDNRYKWNKVTLTHILTRQEYCGDVVNFKTTKHFRDKRNHYVDRSQWQITENVHEPIIDRTDFETVQRILENAPVKRPNGDGEIHPLSGLLFCKDCGAKMHIRIDYRNGGKRHVAYCSEYHKGKAKNPKCHSPHIIDADLLMQTVAEVLKKIEDYSISNRAEFEALVKKNLAMQQTDQTKKQQKRIPQITTRLEQIDKVLNTHSHLPL